MSRFGAVSTVACLLGMLCSLSSADEVQQIWSQWRGPSRNGHISTQTRWPETLSEQNLVERWSVDLGPSYSGPIVTSDRVFVTETQGKRFEVVRCLDRQTGRELWQARWEGAMQVPFFAAANGSWIRATPAYDGDRLYVAGMRDVLVCLDASTGNIIWKRDFAAERGSDPPPFGYVSSPLVLGDWLFVQAGGAVLKLNKSSGETIWETLRGQDGMQDGAFSSPVIATIADTPQLVVQTRSELAGVDLDSGKPLWRETIPAFRGMNILTPTVIGDSVFTSSYGGNSILLSVTKDNDLWRVTETWSHKSQGYMSSPIVIDDHIYLHLRSQRLICLDAKTGQACWTTKPFGKYWSMIANGDQILALDERGDLFLVEASPESFQLRGRHQVADNAWAHLAVAGDRVFVRDLNKMKMLRWSPQ